METCFDRHDARISRFRRFDSAGADADYFVVYRFLVCGNFWSGLDCRHVTDVRNDRSPLRARFKEIDTRSPWDPNSNCYSQHLLWRLVRVRQFRLTGSAGESSAETHSALKPHSASKPQKGTKVTKQKPRFGRFVLACVEPPKKGKSQNTKLVL